MKRFYTDAKKYWDSVDANDNGMLGGYEVLSQVDVVDSKKFLESSVAIARLTFLSDNVRTACDCGAGIGRVSREFLRFYFTDIDLVEQTGKFLETAKLELASFSDGKFSFFPVGLQNFEPQPQKYNVIWCQWVLSHLSDEDLVAFLKRCSAALVPNNGLLIVKENVCQPPRPFIMDCEDSSKTRSDVSFKECFDKAGQRLLNEATQQNFPSELFPVKMYALVPKVG